MASPTETNTDIVLNDQTDQENQGPVDYKDIPTSNQPNCKTSPISASTNVPTSQDSPTSSESKSHQPTSIQAISNDHVNNIEQQLQKSKRDLESMVIKYARSERENLQNKNKVEELDRKLKRTIKDNDSLANRIKLLTNDKTQLTSILNAKVAQLTVLEQKNLNLNNVQDNRFKELEQKLCSLEKTNEDLLKQIETYKNKEGELLDFSERLSMKMILLQSELDKAMQHQPDYKVQYESVVHEKELLAKQNEELLKKVDLLNLELNKEKARNESLQQDRESNELLHKKTVDELQNEIKMLVRKNQIRNKELMRELKQLQSELDRLNTRTDCARIASS